MKKVIICTYNYFTTKYQVGSHNYAKAFEKLGYQVAFISNPISPLHYVFANNHDLKKRDEIYKNGGFWKDNIWYYVPKSLVTPQNKFILSSKYIFENWHKFTVPNIFHVLKEKGFDEVDILWCESPLFSFMLEKINYKKSILRIADFSKGFEQNWEMMYQKEIEISQKVDKVIYTARKLKQQYKEVDSKKMFYVSNGVDLDFIEKTDKSIPSDFENLKGIKVIYIGLIDYWFDLELLYQSSLYYPDYNFFIIGDVKIDISKIKDCKNIHFLGTKEHREISKYLANSDIGIIPFIKSDFVDSINPIKLYEYAAYELKIVSTSWQEVENLYDLFDICDTKEKFINSLGNLEIKNKDKIKIWLKSQDWKLKVKEAIYFENLN